jgi:hypothetical protein
MKLEVLAFLPFHSAIIMADSSSVRLQVASELRPFSDITKSLQYLVSQKHFDSLVEVLNNIYQAEAACDNPRSSAVKEHLKVIVPCMINEIWGASQEKPKLSVTTLNSRKSPSPERTPLTRLGTDKSLAGVGIPTPTVRRSSPCRSSQDLMEPFNKSLSGLSYHHAHSLSDFCHIRGSATFTRSKRPLTKGNEGSPGPAAYRCDKGKLKVNSPRVMIPRGGKKGELFSVPDSPGPAAYYVMRHFVAKHN